MASAEVRGGSGAASTPPASVPAPDAVEPAGVVPAHGPDPLETAGQRAGRGGLAVTAAKVHFIFMGLVQQVALKAVLGLEGYGALSSALGAASIAYNPIVAASLQGVSHAVATASPAERGPALRRTLGMHLLIAGGSGGTFFALAPRLGQWTGAPHIVLALQILSGVLVVYGLYAPLIGALNGQTRFVTQAGLDALAATLRTVGLIGGAFALARWGSAGLGGVEGAALGFAVSAAAVLFVTLGRVGSGSAGSGGPSFGQYLRFVGPIWAGQALLNLLFQADQLLLRRFGADAALAAGLDATAADPLVGAYRATQLFCFLPYQLVLAVSTVLFPMLARAHRERDRASVALYVRQGVRLALIATGLVVSVTCGLAGPLLRLVFGTETAELAAAPMQVLALGLGHLALFGVLSAVLNGLERQRQGLVVTGLACVLVVALCWGRVQGQPLGPGLLWHTALSTSLALAAATLVAAALVRREAGGVVAPSSVLRVLAALAGAVGVARLWPRPGALATLVMSGVVALSYLAVLVILRELNAGDWLQLRRVLSRQRGGAART